MTVKQKIATLKSEVAQFTQQIVRVLSKKPPTVGLADNSLRLNNRTPEQMQADSEVTINAHAARTDNPHRLNGTILSAYTDAQLAGLTDPLLKQGVLPISQFGQSSSASIPVTSNGFTLSFTAQLTFILWGTHYLLPVTNKLITDDVPSPAGKTLYVYAAISNNVAYYKVTETYQIDSVSQMFIGTIICNATAIETINIAKVVKLDNFRMSDVPIGGAIPSSTGLPTAVGSIPAGWKP